MNISQKLQQHIAEVAGVQLEEVVLEHPGDLAHGDYATPVALMLGKREGKNPQDVAQEIVEKLREANLSEVEKIEVAGPGFINFFISRDVFVATVGSILAAGDQWGSNEHVKGYKVIVEYAQPNPFKPFHIGHLMSTAVGESISRLVEFSGAQVFRANYQGDIGPHVAKCLWGLNKEGLSTESVEDLGRAYVAGNDAYENSEEAKAEIEDINRRLYERDPSLMEVYTKGRETSLAHFEDIYKILGTRFDHYFFESETALIGKQLVQRGLEQGIFEKSDSAIVYHGEKEGLHTRVFITSHGTPTYETKEIGLAKAKSEVFPFDLNITTVAIEQNGFFKVVEAALAELLPELRSKYTHLTFGLLQLTSGKMSSRKGNVITGEALIEEMREKVLERMEGRGLKEEQHAIADAVAIAGIKFSILKQSRGKNIIFDPEKSLSLEGDSGPYLQYAHTRARSVLEKSEKTVFSVASPTSQVSEVERMLPRFPEVVFRAAKESEPHHITTYLIELASAFNSWYAVEHILGSEHEDYNLAITGAVAITIKNGLWLLGIEAPVKM